MQGIFHPSFHKDLKENSDKEIKKLVERAKEIPKEGIIAALEGMKIRKNQSALLRSVNVPVLFIIGLKDSKAPLGPAVENGFPAKAIRMPDPAECWSHGIHRSARGNLADD